MADVLKIAAAILVAYVAMMFVGGWSLPSPVDPRPNPGPVDPDRPQPFSPEKFADVADSVLKAAMKVKSKSRKAEAEQLAESLRDVAGQLERGETTGQQAVETITDKLHAMPSAWRSACRDVGMKFMKHKTALNDPRNLSAFCREAAKGLDRAASESTGNADDES